MDWFEDSSLLMFYFGHLNTRYVNNLHNCLPCALKFPPVILIRNENKCKSWNEHNVRGKLLFFNFGFNQSCGRGSRNERILLKFSISKTSRESWAEKDDLCCSVIQAMFSITSQQPATILMMYYLTGLRSLTIHILHFILNWWASQMLFAVLL